MYFFTVQCLCGVESLLCCLRFLMCINLFYKTAEHLATSPSCLPACLAAFGHVSAQYENELAQASSEKGDQSIACCSPAWLSFTNWHCNQSEGCLLRHLGMNEHSRFKCWLTLHRRATVTKSQTRETITLTLLEFKKPVFIKSFL